MKTTILFIFIITLKMCFSQQNTRGVPIYFQDDSIFNQMKKNLNSLVLPALNNYIEQQRADSIRNVLCAECNTNYYGTGIDVSIDIKNQGQLKILKDSSKLWLLKIESSTAYGMQFFFDKFKLPEGARLFIFNEDRTKILGAFTANNNPTDENKPIKFGTQYIQGKKIIIEYNEPLDPEFEGELSIINVIHSFSAGGPFGESDPCNKNVVCPEGHGWEDEIKSVALILIYDENNNIASTCSGNLMNNTSEDGTPLFYTANHCYSGSLLDNFYDLSTWLFLFNHQTTDCNSNGSDVSSYLGESVYGAIQLENGDVFSLISDYFLMELNTSEQVLASYGACYAGWTLNVNPLPPYTAIHHPKSDVKKISIENDPFYTSDNFTFGTQVDIGGLQPGSSGSPIFDSNHKMIGTLSTSTHSFPCPPLNRSSYGKFNYQYTHGNLGFWLDPNNTGQTTVNTYCATGDSGGGGSGGSGGGSQTTIYHADDGFSVNGFDSGIPCVDGELSLRPINSRNGLNPVFRINTTEDLVNCSDADKSECDRSFLKPWKCNCIYVQYFIEISEVNNSLNSIGVVHSKWFTKQVSKGTFFFNPIKSRNFSSIDLSFTDLSSMGVVLQHGKTYRIKLAQNNGGWKDEVRFFKYLPVNISKSGSIQENFSVSNNITISNATVTQPITVVAGNSIRILPGTTLKAGHYYIDETQGCSSFKNKNRLDDDNSDTNKRNPSNRYEMNSSNYTEKEVLLADQKRSEQTNYNIKIYPNPTNGQFNIKINRNDKGTAILELSDILGQPILKVVGKKNSFSFDVSKYPKGIYLLKTTIGDKIDLQKVVYQ
jgi:hypothetical protein